MISEQLPQILAHFSLPAASYQFQPINNGLINDTYLVTKDALPLYVLQRINKEVFSSIESLMKNIALALDHLKSEDYSCLTLVKTKEGKDYFITEEQQYWRLMTYLENSITYTTTSNTRIAFETGSVIGKFHHLLKKADATKFIDTIPQFHSISLREEQFQTALKKALPEKLKLAEKAIIFAKNTLPTLYHITQESLPLRVCHNDTKLNNILFSKKDNKALCLIDLDTIMKGYFYYDFGDAVRTLVNNASEDETDLSKITFNSALFQAFIEGLASVSPFLNQAEIEHLTMGTVYMPFIHGLRALTDYLNNNAYYKVVYENQNLDRCLSLFHFVKLAQEQIPTMNAIISKELVPFKA